MVQKVVERYRPAVAALMPGTLDSLKSYRGRADEVSSLYLGLKNHSMPYLFRRGYCISDIRRRGVTTISRRAFASGERVHATAVYLRSTPMEDQVCSTKAGDCPPPSNHNSCFGRPGSAFQICVMDPASVRLVPNVEQATVQLEWAEMASPKDDIRQMAGADIVGVSSIPIVVLAACDSCTTCYEFPNCCSSLGALL